jgi:DNA-directed RNA polymerase specialized sigma24 family protein
VISAEILQIAGGKTMSKRIYVKSTKTWLDVTDEQYKDHMRECDRIRNKMQSHKACSCPRNKFWMCDGCCDDCDYKVSGAILSMDAPMGEDEGGDEFSLHDIVGDPESDFESKQLKDLFYMQIIHRLGELYPEAITIGQLRLEGKTDTEISEIIGVPRTTFRSRIEKAKKQILAELGEDSLYM